MADGTSIDELISIVNPDPGDLSVRVLGPRPEGAGAGPGYGPDDRVSVHVEGDLDLATAGRLRHALHDVVGQGGRRLDLQLAGVGFCDGAGLRALLSGAGELHALGGTLTVLDPCWSLRRLLELFQLDETLRPVGTGV
ncbi:STAS domain-containing protein [Aquipuribacter hungaricus]|uniref:STAS domain-containing protein n=1 Tax=Aquipuribacter hungaricus TaxID=545624 RepID=A0ABV7WET0_9MICO